MYYHTFATFFNRSGSGICPICISNCNLDISVANSGVELCNDSIRGSISIAADDLNGQNGPTGVNAILRLVDIVRNPKDLSLLFP